MASRRRQRAGRAGTRLAADWDTEVSALGGRGKGRTEGTALPRPRGRHLGVDADTRPFSRPAPRARSRRPGRAASVRGRGWLRPPAAAPPARQAPGHRPGLAGGCEEATEVRPARAPHSCPALTPRPGASSTSSSLLSAAARARALRGSSGSSSGLGSGGGGASRTRTHAARRPRPQVRAPPSRQRFPSLFKGAMLQRVGTAEE